MLSPTILLALSLVALLLLTVGTFLGWMFSGHSNQTTKSKLKTMVAVAVTLVWIATTAADIFITGYTVSPLIHALMGGIVGYFFTDDGIQFNIGNSK